MAFCYQRSVFLGILRMTNPGASKTTIPIESLIVVSILFSIIPIYP